MEKERLYYDKKRKGDVYNPLLGAGVKRLPGACRSGKCRHAARLGKAARSGNIYTTQ